MPRWRSSALEWVGNPCWLFIAMVSSPYWVAVVVLVLVMVADGGGGCVVLYCSWATPKVVRDECSVSWRDVTIVNSAVAVVLHEKRMRYLPKMVLTTNPMWPSCYAVTAEPCRLTLQFDPPFCLEFPLNTPQDAGHCFGGIHCTLEDT